MEIRNYGNKKILIADENKHIRDINDVYIPASTDENGNEIEEHIPYYTSILFLADNFDVEEVNNLYIEEDI